MTEGFLSERDRRALVAIAEVALPGGAVLPTPDAGTALRAEAIVSGLGRGAREAYRAGLRTLEYGALARCASRLSALAPEARFRELSNMYSRDATSWLVRMVTAPLKIAAARDPALMKALMVEKKGLPMAEEPARWRSQITDASELHADETIEVDVVIIGTGAGGAPVAKALAARGHAVLMLEEGGYFSRRDFHGDHIERQRKLYRDRGLTVAMGNTFIPVPIGMTVGGSTTINSGTCYRTPDDVLMRWSAAYGLTDLAPDRMAPWFERVEQTLGVSVSVPSALGGCAAMIARGCDALGWRHNALRRDAVGCDGQGECCFGCPTDAKRSTNVSYVPEALKSGAMVYCNARVTEVLTERGRAVGVRAKSVSRGAPSVSITVRAKAVVLSAGTFYSPAMLLAQKLCNSSGEVGKNLSLHPASQSWASFGHDIRGWEAVPQGWAIEHFEGEGLRFEGAFLPPDLSAATLAPIGPRWTELAENIHRLACFGFMVADTSRGRVTLGPGRRPRVLYWLNDHDRRKVIRGHALLSRVWLAAGATRVMPGLQHFDELRSEEDILRLEAHGPSRLCAHHFDLSAYHPLGTCRLGVDPRRAVVSPTHESFDIEGLFVCDGSAVPSALGVNPQVTIMALSERASGFVERRIEAVSAREKPLRTRQISFAETMVGSFTLPDGSHSTASFFVFVTADPDGCVSRREGAAVTVTCALSGRVTIERVCASRDATGSLWIRPFRNDTTLRYQLNFTDEAGDALTLDGEKHLGYNPIAGLTTLHTRVTRDRDRAPMAHGILRFELGSVIPWLKTWTLRGPHA